LRIASNARRIVVLRGRGFNLLEARAMDGPIRVLVADDHPVYIDGLTAAIERAGDLDLVATCRDGAEALTRIRGDGPDVAVLDLRMPALSARDVLERLEGSACRVLILSVHLEGDEIHECLSLGAAGYIAKDSNRADICEAIRRVAAGGTVLSIEAQGKVAGELRRRHRAERELLSPRESEVLGLLADGASAPDIAGRLQLSTATVKSHLHHLYEKLGVSDRAAAVAEGMRRGLIR
jgi:two-component system nitrate/nitrite response regulator NarL